MSEDIKIIEGNSLEYMRGIPDKSFDWGFTSPPYNRKRNDKYQFYEDKLEDYFTFLSESIDQLLRICKNGVFLNIQTNYYNRQDVYRLIGKYADKIQEMFVWEKTNPLPASGKNITNAVEYFIFMGENRIQANDTYTKNIITTTVGKMPKIHKAVMKQEVSDWFFKEFMHKGESVIDPFFGCGTTAISALKYGLSCTGIELVKEYCEYAEKQIMEYKEEAQQSN